MGRWGFTVVAAIWAFQALGFEEAVRRESADAGVHIPVMTKAPALLGFVQAEYPEEARRMGISGQVGLLVTLAADGTVAEVAVKSPAGHGFDQAAVDAVRRFKFSPAEVDGVPAEIQLEYVYHFTLAPPPAPPPEPPKATLKGQLIARGSRTRVAAATVRCGDDPKAKEAISGPDGRFELEVSPGDCAVRVVANGFHLFQTVEKLAPGETTEVVYYLLAQAQGYETVVRAQRDKKEVVRRTLDREELEKVPGSFGDPIRVLQDLPGVARAPFVSGALIVRGASPSETLTFLDGVQIPLLFHLLGGPSVINPEFLDRLDFYPGGFGARYGRAIGGVVDVTTRKGATDTFHGSAKVDLLDSGLFVQAPVLPDVSVAAAARRSYVDAILPLVLPKDPNGGTLLVLPRYWDYQVRVDVGAPKQPKPGQAVSSYAAMAFGSDDVLKVVASGMGLNQDVSLDVHTLFHRVKADWSYRIGDFTSVFAPYVGYDLEKGSFGTTDLRVDNDSTGAREDVALELGPHLKWRSGADVLFKHLIGRARIPIISDTQYVGFPGAEPQAEMQDIARTINTFDGALYTELDIKAGPFTITPGIRGSYARVHGHDLHAWDPRLWARFQPFDSFAIKGSIGLYTQPPDATQMEPAPFGNPYLVHEKAFQTSLGFEQKVTDLIDVDLTGYFNRRYDRVVSPGETVVNPDGSVTTPLYANDGLGRAYGVEVMLRHQVSKQLFGWIAYTLNRSEVRNRGDPTYILSSYDETHILTAVGSYRLPYGFELGARFRYVTGRPTTPLLHYFDSYNVDDNSFSPTYGDPRSSRLPAFQQLDVRLDKGFVFQSWTLGVYLDVQNVYNAKNEEAILYDYRFRNQTVIPGIPILPVLGVKGTF